MMANQVKPIMLRLPFELDEALRAESARREESINWITMQLLGDALGVDVTKMVRRSPKRKKECSLQSDTKTHLQQPP